MFKKIIYISNLYYIMDNYNYNEAINNCVDKIYNLYKNYYDNIDLEHNQYSNKYYEFLIFLETYKNINTDIYDIINNNIKNNITNRDCYDKIISENDLKNTLSQALTNITNIDNKILFFFIHNLQNKV
jgi:hypothetical protein